MDQGLRHIRSVGCCKGARPTRSHVHKHALRAEPALLVFADLQFFPCRVDELQGQLNDLPGIFLEIKASATCTHLSCTVQYRDDLHEVWCACHNGMYDLNGRNVSGPPPRPLESFEVQVRGEEIYVRRRREA